MRISDWSSDVCSSDLWPALCRARQTGWRGALAGPYLVEAVRDADLGGRPANRAGRDHRARRPVVARTEICAMTAPVITRRSEEHTSELQSLMRISYAVFCLQKNKQE